MKSVRWCPFLFDKLCRLYLCFLFFPIWAFMSPPLTRTLCFRMLRIKEDSSSEKAMSSVSSLTLVGLYQGMIVALRLQLKYLGCIFPMLFGDFRVCGPISIPTRPIEALTEFFHANAVLASIHCQYRDI